MSTVKQLFSVFMFLLMSHLDRLNRINAFENISTSNKAVLLLIVLCICHRSMVDRRCIPAVYLETSLWLSVSNKPCLALIITPVRSSISLEVHQGLKGQQVVDDCESVWCTLFL